MIMAAIAVWFAIADGALSQVSVLSSGPSAVSPPVLPVAPPVLGTTPTVRPKIDNLTMVGGGALAMITVGLALWAMNRIGRGPANQPESVLAPTPG